MGRPLSIGFTKRTAARANLAGSMFGLLIVFIELRQHAADVFLDSRSDDTNSAPLTLFQNSSAWAEL